MSGRALDNFETMMLKAAAMQADTPHPTTLKENGDQEGRLRWTRRQDKNLPNGFHVKALSSECRALDVVQRIQDLKTGRIPFGPPYNRMPGR
jgi:hypothetical protein